MINFNRVEFCPSKTGFGRDSGQNRLKLDKTWTKLPELYSFTWTIFIFHHEVLSSFVHMDKSCQPCD